MTIDAVLTYSFLNISIFGNINVFDGGVLPQIPLELALSASILLSF